MGPDKTTVQANKHLHADHQVIIVNLPSVVVGGRSVVVRDVVGVTETVTCDVYRIDLITHRFSFVPKIQFIYGQKWLIGIIESSEYYGMFWCAFHPLTFSLYKSG